MNEIKTFILYHAYCFDGTGAKYAAWKKFGNQAEYIPVSYHKPPPKRLDAAPADSEIFIVDFSYDLETITALRSRFKRVVILDHHLTSKNALEGLSDAIFDMDKSGAVLTWEYFHPGVPVPRLLEHIQDRDLWKFKLAGTNEVIAGLTINSDEMEEWDKFTVQSQSSPAIFTNFIHLIKRGEAVLEYQNMEIAKVIPSEVIVRDWTDGIKVGILNTDSIISEKGHSICKDPKLGVDFAMMWKVKPDGSVLLSLRSDGNKVDVSKIVQDYFDGGGHFNAAGGRTNLETIVDLISWNKIPSKTRKE